MEEAKCLSQAKQVFLRNQSVYRPARKWSPWIRDFLFHLEMFGLPVEHMRKLTEEYEIYDYIKGEMVHPNRWEDAALFEVGRLVHRRCV